MSVKIIVLRIFPICFTAILFTHCSNGGQVKKIDGKYIDNSKTLSLEFKQSGDSLLGVHCFVVQEGSKIDCCLMEEDGVSLKLRRTDEDTFEGTLHSCYDDEEYKVKVITVKKDLTLFFIKDSHSFVSDNLKFYLTQD